MPKFGMVNFENRTPPGPVFAKLPEVGRPGPAVIIHRRSGRSTSRCLTIVFPVFGCAAKLRPAADDRMQFGNQRIVAYNGFRAIVRKQCASLTLTAVHRPEPARFPSLVL